MGQMQMTKYYCDFCGEERGVFVPDDYTTIRVAKLVYDACSSCLRKLSHLVDLQRPPDKRFYASKEEYEQVEEEIRVRRERENRYLPGGLFNPTGDTHEQKGKSPE